MPQSKLATVIKTTRPPFLILAPICVAYGAALATSTVETFKYFHFFLAITAGIIAHVSVNTFNEYFDFKSGLDMKTSRTPFSGGSNGLPEHPECVSTVLYVAIASLGITFLIGLYFVSIYGFALVPLGLLGCLIIFTYTKWLNKHPFLCWLSPGLGFGPLMVMGTYFVLTGSYDLNAAVASFIPFLLANNLLLLNQLPDEEADREVGRKHIVIEYGKAKAVTIYAATTVLCILVVLLCVWLDVLPIGSLLAMLPLFLGLFVAQRIKQLNYEIVECIPFLGANVAITLLVPCIIAIAILLT